MRRSQEITAIGNNAKLPTTQQTQMQRYVATKNNAVSDWQLVWSLSVSMNFQEGDICALMQKNKKIKNGNVA